MTLLNTIRHFAPLAALAVLASATGCTAEQPSEDGSGEESAAEASQAVQSDGSPLILQDTNHQAKTYEKLAEGWLEWAMALPDSTGPINDPTGEACDLGQHGDIWYLAGTYGGPVTRSCDVPEGKEIYLPLINFWMVPPVEYVSTPEDVADFVAFAEWYFPENRAYICSLTLRLDGEDLLPDTAALDQELWVDIYDPFKVVLNDDNFAGQPGGKKPAALIAGHFAHLEPLSPGDHTLEFGGVQCDGDEIWFETSAVYNIHVD